MSTWLSGVPQRVCSSKPALWALFVLLPLFLPATSGATVCTAGIVASCRMSNGCPGQKECVDPGYWTSCQPFEGLGTATCTTSAQCSSLPGTAWCDGTGRIVACKATEVCNGCDDDLDGKIDNAPNQGERTLAQSCTNACGVSGAQTCKNNAWSGCFAPVEVCNSCDEDLDGVLNNSGPGQGPNTLTRSCNPNSCSQGGTETCTNTGWSGVCTGCGGTASCTNVCGAQGQKACSASCQVEASCSASEVCNNCDDNNNGVVDEGLSCQPCDL